MIRFGRQTMGYRPLCLTDLGKRLVPVDPHRVQIEPLWPTRQSAEAQHAAWRCNSILVIKPGNKTQGARRRLWRPQYQLTIDPEERLAIVPFQYIAVPGGNIDGEQCLVSSTQPLHPACRRLSLPR